MSKPIIALPLYIIDGVKKSKFKPPSNSRYFKDTKTLSQNQFEFTYKDTILNEIMLEFLESKGMINTSEENANDISEHHNTNPDIREKLDILKQNICSDKPFIIESKTATLNNSSSWSNREGEWFLAEKRLLFSIKRHQDMEEWLSCLKEIFK